jgi:hypothetical protein
MHYFTILNICLCNLNILLAVLLHSNFDILLGLATSGTFARPLTAPNVRPWASGALASPIGPRNCPRLTSFSYESIQVLLIAPYMTEKGHING